MSSGMSGIAETVEYRHPDPVVDQALDWAVLMKAGGEPSAETKIAFEAWLAEHPKHQSAWENISSLWGSPEVMLASVGLEKTAARNTPTQLRRTRNISPRAFLWAGSWAAIAVVMFIGGKPAFDYISIRWQADYRTEAGQLQDVSLPDGSRMLLNTQSAVALDFAGNKRGVRLLKGEAWFDVVHDPARPFHVAAKFSDVEVKGTAFAVDVRAGIDTVILERGAVLARHENHDITPAYLQPGQMIRASVNALSGVTIFNPDEVLGWKDGRIILSNRPLASALDAIGSYYKGRIVVLNRKLGDVAISGNYRVDNIEAAIDGIVAAAGGNTMHLPGGIIIIR